MVKLVRRVQRAKPVQQCWDCLPRERGRGFLLFWMFFAPFPPPPSRYSSTTTSCPSSTGGRSISEPDVMEGDAVAPIIDVFFFFCQHAHALAPRRRPPPGADRRCDGFWVDEAGIREEPDTKRVEVVIRGPDAPGARGRDGGRAR